VDAVIVLVLFGVAVLAVIVIRTVSVSRSRSPAGTPPISAGASSGGPRRPNWEAQCSFVLERVERYRDELLRYHLRLERHRRKAPRDVLLKLLDGAEQVISHPVLYLNSDEWKWDRQRLQDAVTHALGELRLQTPTGVRWPTSQAERACDEWAVAEAKRKFDRILGSDGGDTRDR